MERDEKVGRSMRTKLVVFVGGSALLAATLLAVGAFMADKAHEEDAFITMMLHPPT